jgi:hypothetical protein
MAVHLRLQGVFSTISPEKLWI